MIDICRKTHLRRLRLFPCFVSRRTPVVLHHCCGGSMAERGIHRGMGQKVSDWLCLPLNPDYHTGQYGIHTLGVQTWEEMFGTQAELLDQLGLRLGYDLFELAGVKDVTLD